MHRKLILPAIIFFAGFIIFAKCNFADDLRQQRINSVLTGLDKPINYFGKVIDDNNNAVVNAQVNVQISQATGVKELAVFTDSQGVFEITGINGASLLVDKIDRAGYQYLKSNRAGGHDGFENDGSMVINRDNPVIFTMRKKEPPTVVLPGDFALVYEKNVKEYELDLLLTEYDKPLDLQRYHGDNAHGDINTKLEYSAADDSYTFILETPDSDSGIIALDQLLYALPDSGYLTPFKVKVPNNKSVSTYLYVKSRGGQIYARLDAKFAVEKEKIYFAAKVWTNPIGERNVDYDSEKYKEYLRKTDAEAKRMGPKPQ
jgi:hypothetical protein